MIHVKKVGKKPSPDLVKQFAALSSATVHEASGRKGYVDYRIQSLAKGVKVCGPAFTVQCMPGDNLMLHKGLEKAEPGDVLLATVGGEMGYGYGYLGGLMATSAMARQVAGLVIDGCIRDSTEIIEMGFPIFCRGTAIRGTVKASLGLINYPLNFAGTMVNPGDLILGDDDGLVVVSCDECEVVLEKALKRVAMETEKAKVLQGGVSSVQFNKLGPVFASLGLKEE
jgi:4-hydroxy-4-methyl-2-oxoglutarate aldolase